MSRVPPTSIISRPPITVTSPPIISIRSFKIPLRVKNPSSKPYPNRFRGLTTHLTLPRVSAHFGGDRQSRSRRNSLREKILENQQVGSGSLVDSSEKSFKVSEGVNVVGESIGCLGEEERLNLAGKSVLLGKLESWADQYKKDVELWGVGSSPIFTVFEDLGGNVVRVLVDENAIRAGGQLEEDLIEVNLRILHARLLAKDMEGGKSVIARNSTVAKFVVLGEGGGSGLKGVKIVGGKNDKMLEVKELDDVKDSVTLQNSKLVEPIEESGFFSAVRTVVFQPALFPKLSKYGLVGLSGLLVLWTVKSVLAVGQRGKLTTLEKGETEEKSKSEKDEMTKVSVEVVDVSSQTQKFHIRRPKLDKQELLKKMSKSKAPTHGNFQLQQSPPSQGTETRKLEKAFSDIRDVVMHDTDMKAETLTFLDENENLNSGDGNTKMVDLHVAEATNLPDIQDGMSQNAEAVFDRESKSLDGLENENKINSADCDAIQTGSSSVDVVHDDSKTMTGDDFCIKNPDEVLALVQDKESCVAEPLVGDGAYQDTSPSSVVKPVPEQRAPRKKIRIIKSVKEARDYLSRKRDKQEPLYNCEDLLTNEGVSSFWPQSEAPKTGIEIDNVANSKIDLSQKNSALPVAVRSMGMMGDSQPNKKTDHNVNIDIGLFESSAMSQKHHDFGIGSLTVMENQHPHQDDEGILDESTLVSWPQSHTDNNCSRTGDVKNHTNFSQDNLAPVFASSDYTEVMEESQPIGKGNPDSSIDIGKVQKSVILQKNKDPEGSSSAVFAKKEPPQDHENMFSQGGTFSDHQSEDDGATVPQDIMPTHVGDGDSTLKKKENEPAEGIDPKHASTSENDSPIENIATSETNQTSKHKSVTEPPGRNDTWIEKNFHVLDPVVAKIRNGFRENYIVAQEKTEENGTISDLSQLKSIDDDHELEWMKDDHLRDIVFKVRDNELSGREPFHVMSNEDKVAFFDGLQKKVEHENQKLLKVHEYIHSNVENLNYGADGISIYDPPDKVIPRWKGPPIEKAPDFLSKSEEQKDAMVNSNVKSPLSEKSRATSPLKVQNGAPKKPKIIIEGSDGSVKPGKKNGKEFWQHTKKWTNGFLELYNAETDPEMKATMKDIGKDLDRWITEKEIQEAAELIEKMPERNKEFIQKKVEKVKREMELFGPQAVVSKYREYSEEKEEDYLWWLDLPYVLCIELYTNEEGGEQKVGFYSLEMATDLELEPKPCHVIAFEDSKDCKNLCYIIQAHLEMLGSGLAFVVARPPKDTFQESKANGFNVTVIRKGELPLNIDQMLEEVEEQIVEIGSKMYHDQIMKDRSVDMNALMRGVIGDTKPIKRKRARRKLKNFPTNRQ